MAGPGNLKDNFSEVSKVTEVERAQILKAHEEGLKGTENGVARGGVIALNGAVEDKVRIEAEKKKKDEAFYQAMILEITREIREHLDNVREHLDRAAELLAEMEELEKGMILGEDGKPDWEVYAQMYLSEDEYKRVSGDEALIIATLENKLLDDEGRAIKDTNIVGWLQRNRERREEIRGAREDYDKALDCGLDPQELDEDTREALSDVGEELQEVEEKEKILAATESPESEQPTDSDAQLIIDDMGFDF